MTFKLNYQQAFVWIWLPDAIAPVVAGKLTQDGQKLLFNYGRSYLERPNAIAIYDRELPLQAGLLRPLDGMNMPSCIRDAAPDAWGRRVIINRLLGLKGAGADNASLNELTYLLASGSDRIGALDFQPSATEYVPRLATSCSLDELLESAARVEKGIPLSAELDQALHHGSSIGGARPKALIESDEKKWVAKFSSSSDLYSVVKAEFIAMRLAALAGLNVAPVQLATASAKDVLLIERFDRQRNMHGWTRKAMVSALTLFELDEMMARYASYEILAEIVRQRFYHAAGTLKELFSRLVFNILCGNNDDHARNHAAFWDGHRLSLTPAYDICPQPRTGNEASQAMLIFGNQRISQLRHCITASKYFLLSERDANTIIEHQVAIIEQHWDDVCAEAQLNEVDKKLFWHRQFLNPYIFE